MPDRTANNPAIENHNDHYSLSSPNQASIKILLAEDTASDAALLHHALKSAKIPYTLDTLHKGDEVLPWLMDKHQNNNLILPDVILLDLGLPSVDGFEILEEIASAPPAIRAIPVIILTGYEDFEYIKSNFKLSVPAYITKPCNPEKICTVMKHIYRSKAH